MLYQRILVGLDGSQKADKAFHVACQLAKALSSHLYLVWIVNRDRGMDSYGGVNEDFYQDQALQAKAKIQPYVQQAKEASLSVDTAVQIGSIKTILAFDYPKEHNIDLIIIGSTGANAVKKMLQGSHTDYVARHSTADVLIVK